MNPVYLHQLRFTREEATLVKELLTLALPELQAIIDSADCAALTITKAKYRHDCILLFLQTDVRKAGEMPAIILAPVIDQLIRSLEKRTEAMRTLVIDNSLPQDDYLQVAAHSISLVPLMCKLTFSSTSTGKAA